MQADAATLIDAAFAGTVTKARSAANGAAAAAALVPF
jgi:hypothetical protein